jgi:hypothetical protein
MKKARTKIYVKATPERNEVVFSGIEFAEFINYLPSPVENLLLMKGDYRGNKREYNFELLEGKAFVEKLATEDIRSFGDFSFIDYQAAGAAASLNGQQVAEILYMAHLGKPLKSPFFEPLQNRFAYLAHDDGWYCKLYCRELNHFLSVVFAKTVNGTGFPVPKTSSAALEELSRLSIYGILIDLDDRFAKKGTVETIIYTVGEYSDMDKVLNNIQQMKHNASQISNLHCSKGEWAIR